MPKYEIARALVFDSVYDDAIEYSAFEIQRPQYVRARLMDPWEIRKHQPNGTPEPLKIGRR
jgi:hypothetical protein